MSLTGLLVHDITIVRAGSTTDRYGATEKDWDNPTETEVKGWLTQASGTEDRSDGREAQVGSWLLYLPVDTDIVGGDRVTWGSTTFEVDGPPQRAWTPRGEHHVEARLLVVAG